MLIIGGRSPYLKSEAVSVTTPAQLGSFIKTVRKSKGLTQQQFADLSGVGRRFIVECEAGKPRLEFAKVLQVAASAGIDIFAVKR
jgi:y4mF family transcriptional regulator